MKIGNVYLFHGDALSLYGSWPSPVVIVSDGGYGVSGFEGDPPVYQELPVWYRPHIAAWSVAATPQTTLWFWNTEVGWATVHPLLLEFGWEYRSCNVWNKGIAHIAGNSNSQTLRKFPVVTEVCAQYVKEAIFQTPGGPMRMKEWLRREWERSGLPLSKTNEACGVRNAATRKYFTQDHLWYYPPVEAFVKLAEYANCHGRPEGRPYFSLSSEKGRRALTGEEWGRMRSKFTCENGVTNVWDEPPMHGDERLKDRANRCVHLNQKPVRLLSRIIRASSDPGDVVWEPFGGLCSAAVACLKDARACYSAEISQAYYELAAERLKHERLIQSAQPEEAVAAGASRAVGKLGASRLIRARAGNAVRAAGLFQT